MGTVRRRPLFFLSPTVMQVLPKSALVRATISEMRTHKRNFPPGPAGAGPADCTPSTGKELTSGLTSTNEGSDMNFDDINDVLEEQSGQSSPRLVASVADAELPLSQVQVAESQALNFEDVVVEKEIE